MKSLEESASEYCSENVAVYDSDRLLSSIKNAFKAGAEFERKRSEILLEALEKTIKYESCYGTQFCKDAIKKYRESEGGG